MASYYPDNNTPFQPSYQQNIQPHQEHEYDDHKPEYDDIVDQYAAPYAKTAQHQTFAVQTPISPEHRRRPSAPHKMSYSSGQTGKDSDDGSSTFAPTSSYPPIPTAKEKEEKEVDTRTFWQKILPESIACRFYVVTVLVQTTIDLAIEGDLLIRFHEASDTKHADFQLDPEATKKMQVYLSVFALAHVFQFILAVDAVYARNTLQFMALTVFNALFLVYAVIQIGEIRNTFPTAVFNGDTAINGVSHIPIEVLTTIIPIVISVAEIAYIGLGWKIYQEFGWKVYKFLGADRTLKKMFASYQIFECLVKFNVFFWIAFCVQFIFVVLVNKGWEYYVTYAALPLSIILLLEGHLAARHENKWMMITFMSGCVGGMVYFVYKLVKVRTNQAVEITMIAKSLTTFSVISIILLIATFVFAFVVMRNFGRGLKDALDKKREPPTHARFASQGPHARSNSRTLNRMTID